MKKILLLILILLMVNISASAEGLKEEIEKEIGIDKLEEIVPESVKNNDALGGLDISYDNANSQIGISKVLNRFGKLFFNTLIQETALLATVLSYLIIYAVYKSFSSVIKNSALNECVELAGALFLCVVLYNGLLASLDSVVNYIGDILGFMASLLPVFSTVMFIQGSVAESATSSALVLTVIPLIEGACASIVIPFVKILFAFIVSGVVSGLNFSPLTDFFTTFATKTCTISMSLISAILYFQHSLSSSADSLALRSVKLAAGNFIPIVGSMISEASSTVIAAARLVKTTLGVFAFAVLLYVTLMPIVAFTVRRIVLKLLISLSTLLGCDVPARAMSSVLGLYNILSALMLSCGTFFIIAVAVFVKNGVV